MAIPEELEENTANSWLKTGAIKITGLGDENTYYIDKFGKEYYCKNYPYEGNNCKYFECQYCEEYKLISDMSNLENNGKPLCHKCAEKLVKEYPQGWYYYAGDTCKHGVYVGGCGVDHMCFECEME